MDLFSSVFGVISAGAILLLSLAALGRGVWRGIRRMVRIHDLLEKELNNNGGSSMKDQIESANRYAKEASEKADEAVALAADVARTAAETNALAMSHEREFGALTMRVRKLEESDAE